MQLIRAACATALLLASTSRGLADDTFTAKTQVYADNDHTTVVSPLVAISKDAWRGSTLSASYVADIVSSASIDVVSNATRHMNEFRSEVTAGLSQKLKATTLSGSYIYSVEHDYTSHNVNLGVSHDLFEHNTTLALSWNLSQNAITRVGDQAFHRSMFETGATASWTQTLTQKTIMQLSYAFTYDDGYQASPYRFVPVNTTDGLTTLYKVPENTPGQRYRHAFVVALNRHLFKDSALQADYRFYFDNWGLQAHTVQLRYLVDWKRWSLRVRERFYYQRGADFYQPHYTEVQPYMSADRELSTMLSNLAGVRVAYRLPMQRRRVALELEAKGDFLYIQYVNYPLLASRLGGTGELGLNGTY